MPARRLLEDAPAVPRDEQQYGFDGDGQIVVAREYVSPGSVREELRVLRGETVVGYRWSETGAANPGRHRAVRRGKDPLQRTPIEASYDPLGRLLELVEHDDQGEKVLYRARGTDPSTDKLQRRVEDRLVETLPKLVLERAGDEPIYCLVLHYEPEWPLPPTVGLGLERERQAWVDAVDDPKTLS